MNMYVFYNEVCKLLDIEVPELHLGMLDCDKHANAKTYFDKENKCHVYINPKLDFYTTIISLCHELRHCYQMECVYNNLHNEPKDHVKQWKNEMENYTDSKVADYGLQDIELDANAFANYFVISSLGIKVIINGKYNKEELNKRTKWFEKKYGIESAKKIIERMLSYE